jgi:hypothetical protein
MTNSICMVPKVSVFCSVFLGFSNQICDQEFNNWKLRFPYLCCADLAVVIRCSLEIRILSLLSQSVTVTQGINSFSCARYVLVLYAAYLITVYLHSHRKRGTMGKIMGTWDHFRPNSVKSSQKQHSSFLDPVPHPHCLGNQWSQVYMASYFVV